MPAAVGATFRLGIAIYQPPGEYIGYAYSVGWPDNGTLTYVGEEALKPQGMTLCAPAVLQLGATLADGAIGTYGGCLHPTDVVRYEGTVAVVTFRCEKAGRIQVRMLAPNEAQSLGTSLIAREGVLFAEEVDNGLDIV